MLPNIGGFMPEEELKNPMQIEVDALRQEKQQLVGMILRIRKAFYQVGTTKAMRETMKEINDEFRILRGEIKP